MSLLRQLFGRKKPIRLSRPTHFEEPCTTDEAWCADQECPCDNTRIPRGEGYMYVSRAVVEMRKDAPTVREFERKLERLEKKLKVDFLIAPRLGVPILMCEEGARRRRLNLEVAAADARLWWNCGKVPLRATPTVDSPFEEYADDQQPPGVDLPPGARRQSMKILLALAATLLAGATVGFSVALPTVRHSVEQRLMVRDMQNVVTASSVSCLPSVDFGDKEGADSSLSDILSAFPYVMEGWIALPNEDLFAYYARNKSRAAKPKRKDVPADGVHMEPNAIIACGAIAQKPESRVGTLCISGSPQGFRSFD